LVMCVGLATPLYNCSEVNLTMVWGLHFVDFWSVAYVKKLKNDSS
jgi:hypothetical protein